jgi:hypothetical protein
MAEPSLPSKISRLLQLPRELRDIIYDYAVGGKHTIVHVERDGTMEGRLPTANWLALVCRQTHDETAANVDVDLYCMAYASPKSSYPLTLLSDQIGMAATARLGKIVIHGAPNLEVGSPLSWREVNSYVHRFRAFCKLYPRTNVILRFRHVAHIENTTWLSKCIALKVIIRGADTVKGLAKIIGPEMTNAITIFEIPEVLTHLDNTEKELSDLPSNLRISIHEAVPETTIATMVKSVDTILPYARKLWEEGI